MQEYVLSFENRESGLCALSSCIYTSIFPVASHWWGQSVVVESSREA